MIKDQLTKNNTVGPNTREIEKLRKVFPHYFDKNGDFMIDRLKELLSSTDVEMRKEGYELKFLGKSYAKLLTSTETKTVLTPIIEHNTKGINAESKNVCFLQVLFAESCKLKIQNVALWKIHSFAS